MKHTLTLAAAFAVASASAWAECPKDLGAPAGHAAHASHAAHAEATPSTQAYAQANAAMHKGMDITYSGDGDIDFLRGMIAHHQGAVDMAQIQLKYGKDAQVKKLSREIIRAQELEIRWMKGWLKQLESRQTGHTDKGWLGDHSTVMP